MKRVCIVLLGILLAGCSGAPSPQNVVNNLIGPCGAPVGYSDLAWSPDSSRIALTLLGADGNQIAVMNADGGGLTRISDPAGSSYSPGWSPDGKHLVFITETQNNLATAYAGGGVSTRRIDVINVDGSGQMSISSPGDFYAPFWSPDGRQILFKWRQDTVELYRMDADGANVARVNSKPGDFSASNWAAEPGSGRIAFVSNQPGIEGLYVVNADGTGERRLMVDSNIGKLAWSPAKSSLLAYVASYQQGYLGIYVISADDPGGSPEGTLLTPLAGEIWNLAWAADGESIVFDSQDNANVDIFSVKLDGSALIGLTMDHADDVNPMVSLDGKSIAFLSYRDGEGSEVYTMGIDGSNQRRITQNPVNQQCLKWPF